MASIKQRPNGKWRARYRDHSGKEHVRHFKFKNNPRSPGESAQHWVEQELAALTRDDWVEPSRRNLTVADWCDQWIKGYERHRASTVRQAKTHLVRIKKRFGDRQLRALKPSDVLEWIVAMQDEGLAANTIYALHSRLAQLCNDAVHDGILTKSPTSRRTSPPMGRQRPHVATTAQVWALYEAMPENVRKGILLGAFGGLRAGEVVVFRPEHLDAAENVLRQCVQYPAEPLKTEHSLIPIPVPKELVVMLTEGVDEGSSLPFVRGEQGQAISKRRFEEVFRAAREKVPDLPEGFRFHDLRHYFASLLIAAGLDIKTVQHRVRHASAKTTLDTYGHMFPDKDEASRSVVAAAILDRAASPEPDPAETPAD